MIEEKEIHEDLKVKFDKRRKEESFSVARLTK